MDTIVAQTTPWGRGATSVLRLSGPAALVLAQALCPGGPPWTARRLSLRQARDPQDGVALDAVLAAWMPGPRSFTGEDVVELSCHGNPVLVDLLQGVLVQLGARPARPGEFTRRALENGRTTLLGAEALDGLIQAASPAGIALARRGLSGESDHLAAALRESLLDGAAELEARLDHPDDDLGYEDDLQVAARLEAVATQARTAAEGWRVQRARLHGASVALVGPVNAGKSSLFNRLLGEARALVSPQPGTTRDVVERATWIDGVEVRLLDTAGERAAPVGSVEAEGIALGQSLTADVDLLLVVVPLHQPRSAEVQALLARTASRRRLIVGTHLDQLSAPTLAAERGEDVDVQVSSVTGAGIEALRAQVRLAVAGQEEGGRQVVLSQRQHDLLRAVAGHAAMAAEALLGALGPAVAAEEVTSALERLAELSGEDVREAVLDRLFSRFCVGK